jgi:iron complex transport system permease protein
MDALAADSAKSRKRKRAPQAAAAVLAGGMFLLLAGLVLSIVFGAVEIQPHTVWDAVFRYDSSSSIHLVIRELRLPRALAGVFVGAGLAVAGAVMQGLTRNPLADSGLLGLNAGAALVLAVCFALVPGLSYFLLMVFCFAGAALGAVLAYGVGSFGKGGINPQRLTIAGAAVSALLLALSEGISLLFRVSQDLAFWYAGGLAGIQWIQVKSALPWLAGGIAAAMMFSRSLTVLSMGEEVASGLGQHTGRVRMACLLIVVVLAGCSVSLAGPVAFVGLIIPHMARVLVGLDYRWIIPCSAVLGALLMVYADLAARMIRPPYETPVGALIALLGVPVFLWLARRDRGIL